MREKIQGISSLFVRVIKEIFVLDKKKSLIIWGLLFVESINSYILVTFVDYIAKITEKLYGSNPIEIREITYILFYLGILMATKFFAELYPIEEIKFNSIIDIHLQKKIKDKLSSINYEYFESSVVYEKLNRVNEKVVTAYQTVFKSIIKISELLLFMVIYTIYLFKVNVFFAIASVMSIVFSGIVADKMSKNRYEMMSDLTHLNQKRDYLDRIPKDKTMHQEYQSNRLKDAICNRYTESFFQSAKGYLKIHKTILMFTLVIFFSYLYLGIKIRDGLYNIGIIISLIIIFDNLFGKSEALSYFISNRIEDVLIIKEYFEIMDLDIERKDDEVKCKICDGTIKFNNVSYRYPQADVDALKNINLNIESGEKIAVVGENGSGKTTFCNILLGLLTNFNGEIYIGRNKFSSSYTIPVGMIKSLNQDFSIYQTSIYDNIYFGSSSRWKDEMKIRKMLNMDFMHGDGKDINIGQIKNNGLELSKGQEQKLAILRMLANSQVPIWIFDEPTAYLDPIAEIEIYKFLYKLDSNKTMLFISHRLGFAPMADRIIVFENGMIAENGTHDELLSMDGTYAKMYAAQKKFYEE